MKRRIFIVTGVLLIMLVLSTGCATKPAAPTPPTPPPSTKTITGNLTGINTPAEPGKDVVTVKTPQGEKTIPIAANATFSLDGKACTLDQLDALELAKESYNCTIVMGFDEAGTDVAVAFNVTKIYPK